jgi:serine/threonine protein kinase
MGDLYEATQLSLGRRVALKVISTQLADSEYEERFRREARMAASLDHPNILPVYQTGELADGTLYMAMRLNQGPDLRGLVKKYGPLSPGAAVAILSQVGEALDAAHGLGLVHRDVKPANVLLESREGAWHAYLTDFGIAFTSDHTRQTAPGQLIGTVDYLAPEQIMDGATGPGVDVYAFGCMLYECLTGAPPYRRDVASATLIAHISAPTPLPSATRPGLPKALDVVVARAMEKEPDKRAASLSALMRWAGDQLNAAGAHGPSAGREMRVRPTICTTCGHVNRSGGGFCRQCGSVLARPG